MGLAHVEGLVALCKLSGHIHIVSRNLVILVAGYHPYVEGLIVGVADNANLLVLSIIEGESVGVRLHGEGEEKQNYLKGRGGVVQCNYLKKQNKSFGL